MRNDGGRIYFLVYESLNSLKGELFYENGCCWKWVLSLGIFLIRR